ncbi:MAG: PSD1 and planctomycete cytochrome C domain-containing protein [Verrucomicrobiales bacterium]|nr:PSD1 and planctomycete cytochrome C domain-containing protein [Verrucomicrobiales bacterium]
MPSLKNHPTLPAVNHLTSFLKICFILSICLSPMPSFLYAAESKIEFNRDIRPILSETCFRCHGPDKESREADLRLDLPDAAYADVDGHIAIVPGDLKNSLAWQRIITSDDDELMPPPDSHLKIKPEEKALIKRWIEQGAKYQGHWSFIPPKKAPLPATQSKWPKNEIDHFVLKTLRDQNLSPAAEASRRQLIRRLSFDLTGLPPSNQEVHAFIEDENPQAYANLVDRLLSSRHYGERMAVPWLDQARYADTNGYSIDGGRHMSLWRDWVIHAYNSNLPFDQFTIEQLAGDLLPNATPQQIVASGFNRNHMITHEGGTIPLENLTNYAVDRVNTTSQVWLGLTMACSQCHDHKFDPLTMKDYYRMFAYFNTLDDKGNDGNGGINARPTIKTVSILRSDSELKELQQELQQLQQRLKKSTEGQKSWQQRMIRKLATRGKNLKLHPLKVLKVSIPNRGNRFTIKDHTLVEFESAGGSAHSVSLEIPKSLQQPITGLRIEFLPDAKSPQKRSGFGKKGFEGSFILTGFSVSATTIPSDQTDLYTLLDIREATASFSNPNYPPNDCLDEHNNNGWSPYPGGLKKQHLTLNFTQALDPRKTPFLTTLMNWGGGEFNMSDHLIARKYRMYAITGHDDNTNIPKNIQTLLNVKSLNPSQKKQLSTYYVHHAPELANLRHRIDNLQQRIDYLDSPQSTLVMDTAKKPRETFMLVRGQYDQRTTKVTPGTPRALPPLPSNAPDNRLGFAQWLVQRNHPLTARVAVNRLWQNIFGTGIVASSGDFGSQGAWPSHPQLLDWLAVDFIDSGWDTKAMIRKMVLSNTYRQNSATTANQITSDPQNRLLARGPRFRLQAEFIRDSALKISHLLSPRIGGPSVSPYQPPSLWKEVSHYGSSPATAQVFIQDHGEFLYRRSLYTYWKRTVPPPSMLSFDAPNRETCTISRATTNTPLQALTLLNDPQFVEASRSFARRILTEAPKNTEARIRFAFEACTSRLPKTNEIKLIEKTLKRELAHYTKLPTDATALLEIGESPRNQKIPTTQHAAWTTIASLIMNLSETITRE